MTTASTSIDINRVHIIHTIGANTRFHEICPFLNVARIPLSNLISFAFQLCDVQSTQTKVNIYNARTHANKHRTGPMYSEIGSAICHTAKCRYHFRCHHHFCHTIIIIAAITINVQQSTPVYLFHQQTCTQNAKSNSIFLVVSIIITLAMQCISFTCCCKTFYMNQVWHKLSPLYEIHLIA